MYSRYCIIKRQQRVLWWCVNVNVWHQRPKEETSVKTTCLVVQPQHLSGSISCVTANTIRQAKK